MLETTRLIRNYSELKQLNGVDDRFKYLRLGGIVGDSTFGFSRCLNQTLYSTKKWKEARDFVIIRDNGCDLGVDGYRIVGHVFVHHMNPMTVDDILEGAEWVFDPEYLICVSDMTHRAIHYGDESLLPKDFVGRKPNDLFPWR